KSVSGTASANKEVVQDYVRLLLGLEVVPRPDHAADALAAAITHIHASVL
ncbi:crossover junction endodeoxyribonuclease RuvC, partial [Treponema berlinense]